MSHDFGEYAEHVRGEERRAAEAAQPVHPMDRILADVEKIYGPLPKLEPTPRVTPERHSADCEFARLLRCLDGITDEINRITGAPARPLNPPRANTGD